MNEGPSHRRVNRENDERAALHPALSQPVGSSVGHSTVLSPPSVGGSVRIPSHMFPVHPLLTPSGGALRATRIRRGM